MISSIFSQKDELVPPRRLIFIGSGNFVKIGQLFQDEFVNKGILTPDSRVLDIGSGIGRSAMPLTKYITTGSYDGFDIVKAGIAWCNKHIAVKYPNFRFKHVELFNDLYSSEGDAAEKFVFPYPDDAFDLALSLSVFTHMTDKEVRQYLSEIKRVLKPGGYFYCTFFILNENSSEQMALNDNAFNFKFSKGHYALMNDRVESANVAYDETYLLNDLVKGHAFNIKSIEYGTWSTGKPGRLIDFQDRLILHKPQ